MPPSVSDDGDAAMQAEKIRGAGNGEDLTDARLFFDVVEVGGGDFAGEDGTFFVDGPEHVGNAIVDAVEISASNDGEFVDAGRSMADDFVVFRIFE